MDRDALGYSLPASSAGYLRPSMYGIWVAVNATTSYGSLSRKKVLKLWKSRPAAPMMKTFVRRPCPLLHWLVACPRHERLRHAE